MSQPAVLRLIAEVESDLATFQHRAAEVRGIELDGAGSGELARAALALHHAYSAVESILERVSRQIEGSLPIGADWHKSLLDSATLEIPGVRPALLEKDTARDLHELRGFRHFLRHAYAVELDEVELLRHRETTARLTVTGVRDIRRVVAWLTEVAARS